MPRNDDVLRMEEITKEFSGVRALDVVTLSVRRGEVHAICGENGAGKSTLMNVLSGVYPYGSYGGTIEYDGEKCRFHSVRDSENRGIAIIHQELALSPFLSVAENIFLGNEITIRGVIDWHRTNLDAKRLLDRVGLRIDPQERVVDLGVGQQQLVEIARALSKNVKLLILDEPTAALNDNDSAHLLELMRELREDDVSMVIISHKLAEIEAIADSITVLRDGRSVGGFDDVAVRGVSQDEVVKLMVGRELESRFPDHESALGDVALEVEGWSVFHPTDAARQVIHDASIHVRAGEIVGIAGLMGAGRTELAMSVFGRQWGIDARGMVRVNGAEIDTSTVASSIAGGLAYVPEDRKSLGLNLIQSIRTNITAAALPRVTRRGVIESHEEERIAHEFSANLRIKAPSVETKAETLSGGNQQKVVLSKWIYADAQVLILDEPTRGIDVGAKYEIYQIIHNLVDQGKAVLFISSELPEILGVCDRIYTMSQGRITGEVSRDEANQEGLLKLMTREPEKE